MKKITHLLTVGLILLTFAVISAVAQNMGAESVTLDGGSRGDITFPHRMHQETLGDCTICHDVFPMEKGAIVRLKSEGKLKNKMVMNQQCIGCHKEYKAQGKNFGPVRCSECHKK